MIRRLSVKGITVFPEEQLFPFVPGLNIFVGGNDSGKSHLMRLCYAVCKWSTGDSRKDLPVTWAEEKRLRQDLLRAFGVRELSTLVSRFRPAEAAVVHASLYGEDTPIGSAELEFRLQAGAEAPEMLQLPQRFTAGNAVFLAPQEVLSVYPYYVQVGRRYPELLDSATRELCRALETEPTQLPSPAMCHILALTERLLRGKLVRRSGRFYLQRPGQEPLELMAEGFKRTGTLALLIENGSVGPGTTLFWDEPEMNLNAAHLPQLVQILLALAKAGVQVMLTTHSLFLLRELTIQLAETPKPPSHRFFGLTPLEQGVRVCHADALTGLDTPESLEAEMIQADRYLSLRQSPTA